MKQSMVPALPTERVQYERWYQLGLNAVMAASTTLQRLHTPAQPMISAFPRFTVFCAVNHGEQHAAAIKQAAANLAVVPIEVDISRDQVALTFGLNWLAGQLPVWHPTEGGVLRLYDGLLTNLLGSAFQPITEIQVTISDLEMARGPQATPTATTLHPNFSQFGVDLAAGGLMSVVQAAALQWQPGVNGTLLAQGYAGEEEEELLDQPACDELKHTAVILKFPTQQ